MASAEVYELGGDSPRDVDSADNDNCLSREPSCDHEEFVICNTNEVETTKLKHCLKTSEGSIHRQFESGNDEDLCAFPNDDVNPMNDLQKQREQNVTDVINGDIDQALGDMSFDAVTSDDIANDDGSVINRETNDTNMQNMNKEEVVNDGINSVDSKDEDDSTKVDILGNGLLIKKVVNKGDGNRPKHGEVVTISSVGRINEDTCVDKHETLTFTLGDGDAITALELCLPLMELNETCELMTDSKYAYGSHGNSFDIPPHASITYTVTLASISPAPDYSAMTIDETIHLSEEKRQRGNYHFERGDYSSAITSYTKALKIADSYKGAGADPVERLQSLLDVSVKCYNNLAASQLKIEAYVAAIKSCESVLKYSSENVKALFRKAKACSALGLTKEACVLLKKALQLEPESRLIHVELSRLTNKLKDESQSAKNMYKKMFGLEVSEKNRAKSTKWKTWGLTLAGAVIVTAIAVSVAVYRHGNQH